MSSPSYGKINQKFKENEKAIIRCEKRLNNLWEEFGDSIAKTISHTDPHKLEITNSFLCMLKDTIVDKYVPENNEKYLFQLDNTIKVSLKIHKKLIHHYKLNAKKETLKLQKEKCLISK